MAKNKEEFVKTCMNCRKFEFEISSMSDCPFVRFVPSGEFVQNFSARWNIAVDSCSKHMQKPSAADLKLF